MLKGEALPLFAAGRAALFHHAVLLCLLALLSLLLVELLQLQPLSCTPCSHCTLSTPQDTPCWPCLPCLPCYRCRYVYVLATAAQTRLSLALLILVSCCSGAPLSPLPVKVLSKESKEARQRQGTPRSGVTFLGVQPVVYPASKKHTQAGRHTMPTCHRRGCFP